MENWADRGYDKGQFFIIETTEHSEPKRYDALDATLTYAEFVTAIVQITVLMTMDHLMEVALQAAQARRDRELQLDGKKKGENCIIQ